MVEKYYVIKKWIFVGKHIYIFNRPIEFIFSIGLSLLKTSKMFLHFNKISHCCSENEETISVMNFIVVFSYLVLGITI